MAEVLMDPSRGQSWVRAAQLLTQGYTYQQLVWVPEAKLPAFVSSTIKRRLDRPGS